MEYNAEIKKIYDITKDITSSDITSVKSKCDDAIDTLKTKTTSIFNELGLKSNWDDSISQEINSNNSKGIDNMIKACKSPADEVMKKTGSTVDSLNENIKNYFNCVDNYNLIDSNLKNKLNNPPKMYEEGTEVKTVAYKTWENEVNVLKGQFEKETVNVSANESIVKDVINSLKGLLSEIGSKASSSALASGLGSSKLSDKDSDFSKKLGYDEKYSANVTRYYDENGNVIKETYEIFNVDDPSSVVETGVINYTYDANGNKIPEHSEFYKKPEEPTVLPPIDAEEVEEEPSLLEAYIDDEVVPETETITEDLTITPPEVEGEDSNYERDTEYESRYANGVVKVGKVTEEGVYDTDGNFIPAHMLDKFELQLTDGTVYDGITETQFNAKGLRTSHTEITDVDGDTLLTADGSDITKYHDNEMGGETLVEETQVNDGRTTTIDRTTTYYYGVLDDGVTRNTVIINNDNHSTGSFIDRENGIRYDYYIDEGTGKLMCQESYLEDCDFLWSHYKAGDPVGKPKEVEEVPYKFTIKNPDGSVFEETVNYCNEIEMARIIAKYEDIKMECGEHVQYASKDFYQMCNIGYGEVGAYQFSFEPDNN